MLILDSSCSRFRSETPYLNDSAGNGSVSCDYSKNMSYVVFSAMGSFFVPLTVMLYVYARISCVIANRHDNLEAMNTAQHVKWPLNNTVNKLMFEQEQQKERARKKPARKLKKM